MLNKTDMPRTLTEAIRYFYDELFCVEFIRDIRWPDGQVVCPNCKETNNKFMESRKVWQCKNKQCKKQFSVKVGTIFEDSPIKLRDWLTAMWLIVNAKNGISSYELGRAIGITQKSAWHVNHRIRIAMSVGSIEKLTGTVEVDETFIGGASKNMHAWKREEKIHGRGSAHTNKTCVMGMLQRGGKVRAKVIKNTDGMTLYKNIVENVKPHEEVHTDQWAGYAEIDFLYKHEVINHSIEFVRDNVHTNSIENFWSLLKRTIKGTYVSVSPAHLQKYVEEQVFRYNERHGNDSDRFEALIESISGKRLTYNQLIGYETGR